MPPRAVWLWTLAWAASSQRGCRQPLLLAALALGHASPLAAHGTLHRTAPSRTSSSGQESDLSTCCRPVVTSGRSCASRDPGPPCGWPSLSQDTRMSMFATVPPPTRPASGYGQQASAASRTIVGTHRSNWGPGKAEGNAGATLGPTGLASDWPGPRALAPQPRQRLC